jgi:hypothetical protein
MQDYPEHRLQFFSLLHAITRHCFQTLLTMSPPQLKLVIDSIVWAFRHTEVRFRGSIQGRLQRCRRRSSWLIICAVKVCAESCLSFSGCTMMLRAQLEWSSNPSNRRWHTPKGVRALQR